MSNHELVANEFNNYFINGALNLPKYLEDTDNQFKDYLKNPDEHSFFLKETEPPKPRMYTEYLQNVLKL